MISSPHVFTITERIYNGSSHVSRAKSGETSYIVKTYSKRTTQNGRYLQEFLIGSSIHSPYVVKFVDCRRLGSGFALVTEDIGGVSIRDILKKNPNGIEIDLFLELALKITQGLGAIHAAGVTHKDINPANIIYNTKSKALNIIDFGIASRLARKEVSPTAVLKTTEEFEKMSAIDRDEKASDIDYKFLPSKVEGTAAYMSPEQTGRMNRPVDYRSDFYALGITFYEMLSGTTPFAHSKDALDLVYKHMAIIPDSLIKVKPMIGKVLSDVVDKLISKNAEDRYQSSNGLLSDLLNIQRMYSQGSFTSSSASFLVGAQDVVRVLQVSNKLYGREIQSEKLRNSFSKCSSGQSPCLLVLVHGLSGVGKTALVNEVHKPLARKYGYYAKGKFDQFMTSSPYSALTQAVKHLIYQILTESEASLQLWKKRILSSLGENGQVVIDLIPDLVHIIGPQPKIAVLDNVERLNRFQQIFISFLFSLATKDHPLVFFLDDLQWADSNTLSLLGSIMGSIKVGQPRYILFVGAYRDNEVGKGHLLQLAISEMSENRVEIEDVQIESLHEHHITQLVRDTFKNQDDSVDLDADALGALVYKKTQGNPFFVNNIITTLYRDGHITFINDPIVLNECSTETTISTEEVSIRGRWTCNVEAIQQADYTNNVVELMVTTLRDLNQAEQRLLGVAAIIGNEFLLDLLSKVCEITEQAAGLSLGSSLRQGFLSSASENFMENIFPEEKDKLHSTDIILLFDDNLLQRSATDSQSSLWASGALAPSPQIRRPSWEVCVPSSPFSHAMSSSHTVYRFGHDRIQQAASALIPSAETCKVHIKIAETMLEMHANTKKMEFDTQYLFSVVNHIIKGLTEDFVLSLQYETELSRNTGSFLPFSGLSLAQLFMLATNAAKTANGYAPALEYANTGLSMLMKDDQRSWKNNQLLMFDLSLARAELLVYAGQYETADAECKALLNRDATIEQKTNVYAVLRKRFETENRMDDALEVQISALSLYGINLPSEDELNAAGKENNRILYEKIVRFPSPRELLNYRECVNPTQKILAKLLMELWVMGYITAKRPLSTWASSEVILRSLQYGLFPETGMALVIVGVGTEMTRLRSEMATTGLLILANRFPASKGLAGTANAVYAVTVSVWISDLVDCIPYIEASNDLNVAVGNLTWKSFSAYYTFEHKFMRGIALDEVIQEYEKVLPFYEDGKYGMVPFVHACGQPMWDVRNGRNKDLLGGLTFEESIFSKVPFMKSIFNYSKMMSSLFLRDDKNKCLHYADEAVRLVPECLPGLFRNAETETMASLIYLDWASHSQALQRLFSCESQEMNGKANRRSIGPDTDVEAHLSWEEQIALLKTRLSYIKQSIEKLSKYTELCEVNFSHKELLLRAEAVRISLRLRSSLWMNLNDEIINGAQIAPEKLDFKEAMDLYEAAIESASRFGFNQYEALALELYGRFWLESGPSRASIARIYLRQAYLVYERWGASEKAGKLKAEIDSITTSDFVHNFDFDILDKNLTAVIPLDLEAIVRTSQAISTESNMDELVLKMVRSIVETSSSQKGTFLVVNNDMKEDYTFLEAAENEREMVEEMVVVAQCEIKTDQIGPSQTEVLPLKQSLSSWNGPTSVIRFVQRTKRPLILACAHKDAQFSSDEYFSSRKVMSALCIPVMFNNMLKGIVYLENNLHKALYSKRHVDLLGVMATQMIISIDNVRFYNHQMFLKSQQIKNEMLQKENESRRADAAEWNKLKLENFINMICHEIRNPLNSIIGSVDMLIDHLKELETIAQPFVSVQKQMDNLMNCVSMIQTCTQHQTCMCDDIVQLSELREHKYSVNKAPFAPMYLVQAILHSYMPSAQQKGIDMELEVTGELISTPGMTVEGDAMRINQILMNIVSNAVKFTNHGTVTITVSAESSKSTEQDDKSNSCDITFCIKDTGIGMTPEEVQRLFKRFSQSNKRTAKEYGGSGLGLAICKKLVKLLGGTISTQSEKGIGSTFCISLPCERLQEKDLLPSSNTEDSFPLMRSRSLPTSSVLPTQRVSPHFSNSPGSHIFHGSSPPFHHKDILWNDSKLANNMIDNNIISPDKSPNMISPHLTLFQTTAFDNNNNSVPPPSEVSSLTPLLHNNEKPQKRILVVEDNLMNQKLLSRLLQLKGFHVDVTNNGEEGFHFYCAHQEPGSHNYYSFVLMDIQMPIMDGLASTTLIRKYEVENGLERVKIIGISANVRDEQRQAAMDVGMDEYITKPYNRDLLYYHIGVT